MVENQTIDPETKKKALDDLLAFEEEISQKNKKNIFGLDELSQRKAAAENEKIKGNEALKSNDLNEALNYYTKSLEYDPNLTASYCNRALVYLKMKSIFFNEILNNRKIFIEFKETIEDCNKVLEIDSSYIKAYHRRGKAYLELKNYVEAVRDFQAIMKLEPENKEVNADLKEARKNLTQKDLESLEKNPKNQSGFKKIQIQEEEEEEEDDKNSRILKEFDERKQKANELTKKGLFVEAIPFYETDLKLIDKMKNAPNEILAHKANLLNNISFCYAQSGEASKAIGYATDVINLKDVDVDQKVKALLRRGNFLKNMYFFNIV